MDEQEKIENQQQEDQTPKTFDEILADKTYQSEFDKRVTKALETAKIKWDESVKKEQPKTETSKQDAQKGGQPAISPEVKALQEQVAALAAAAADKDAKLAEKSEIAMLETMEVPENQRRFYRFEITELAKSEELQFADAAKKYIEANPPIVKPPSFAAGKPAQVANQTEKDRILAEAKSLMGIK